MQLHLSKYYGNLYFIVFKSEFNYVLNAAATDLENEEEDFSLRSVLIVKTKTKTKQNKKKINC